MKEIKVKVENVFDFFCYDHKIADYFVNAVKNGEVKNFKYNVFKDGACTFSFERKNKKYVMDPEMDRYYAMIIIEFFQKTAFTLIHKKPEKLNLLIERFKKKHFLKNLFGSSHYFVYDVETHKYEDDDLLRNKFSFTLYDDSCQDEQKSEDEIIEKNGGVTLDVNYNDFYFYGNMISYNGLNNLVEEDIERRRQVEMIRKIVTETYFKN